MTGGRVDPVLRSGARLTLAVLPFVILAALVILRLAVGTGIGLLPLLALGPAFAAVASGLRMTIAVGATAVVLSLLLAFLQPRADTARHEAIAIGAVLGVTAASLLASMLRRRRDRELADVRAVAEVAQRVLLHPVPERVNSLQFAVRYISASAQARIGGDLYEAVVTPAGVRLIVGDVEGKGLEAVTTAGTVLGTFREAAYDEPDLTAIAARIETSLARQRGDEHFVTAILAEVSRDEARITLLNCGHPPPLLAGPATSRFVGLDEGGLPLGLSRLADLPRVPQCMPLAPGEQILFYTDGVSEARNSAGEFFPLATSCCARAQQVDPGDALDRLSADVRRHVGHALDDDAAMLLIRRQGPDRDGRSPSGKSRGTGQEHEDDTMLGTSVGDSPARPPAERGIHRHELRAQARPHPRRQPGSR